MIHIATVHWRSDRWIDIQRRYLERNVDQPYRTYAWLGEELRDHADEFFYATDVAVDKHELKLTLLGDLVAHAAADDEMIIFIDGDAFPIAPIVPFLRGKLERYPLVAVRRDENNGDPQPHPCFCATTAGFWRRLPGDWRRGHTWVNPQGKEVTDVGGNLLGLLERAGIDWYPMLRTNKVNPHPLQFGVYDDLVYHHGGGFRLTAGGRLGGHRSRTGSTPRFGTPRSTAAARRARWPGPEANRSPAALSQDARCRAGEGQRAGLRSDPARRGLLPPTARARARRGADPPRGASAAPGRRVASV